jgi:hypothetical protein
MRRPVPVSPVKAIFAIRGLDRQRFARFKPESIHNIQNAGGEQIGNQFRQHKNTGGRLLGRFQHDAVTRGEGRRQFPGSHQDRKIPGNDLSHYSQRLVEMVSHGVRVDLRNGAFLRAHAAGKIPEMVDGEGYVRVLRLADGLAVIPGFGGGEELQIILQALRNAIEDVRPLCRADRGPFIFGGMGSVQRRVHVSAVGTGDPAEQLAIDGR